jgi:hypothetical protein
VLSAYGGYHSFHGFGPFKQLSKLHTLRVDINRLIDGRSDVPAQVTGPKQMLPDSLRQLHLTKVPRARINRYYHPIETVMNSTVTMNFILDVAKSLTLEFLSIKVNNATDMFGTLQHPSHGSDHLEIKSETLRGLQDLVNDGTNATQDIRFYAAASEGNADGAVYLLGPGHVLYE